jgi:hypothetical protein
MRPIFATLLILTALLPATAAAQDPVPPVVVTGPAQSVGQTSATATGTVDPNGTATTYHFEYGTTTDYGLETTEQPAGAGDSEVAVQALVEKLTPATTYHYRLVARGVAGADRTFTTAAAPPNPTPPGISRLAARDKTTSSVRLTARINPRGAATTYHVEWGTTTAFGNRTPDQTIPAGPYVQISVTLDGLQPYTRIYWRVVAANAAGVARSGTANVTTPRALSGVTLNLFPAVATWSRTVSISGRVQGAGLGGLTVALEQTSFPFAAAYHQVATARVDAAGGFRFPALPVYLATRFRAVTRNAAPVTSPVLTSTVRPLVGVHASHRTRRSLRLVGGVHPGLPAGQATLQRRKPAGGWRPVKRAALQTANAVRSNYLFTVSRSRRAARYRVVITPGDGGAHATGTSRAVRVGKRR